MASLNGKSIVTVPGLHQALKDALQLPDDYGMNLDSLWDCLTGWIDTPLVLVWKDYAATEQHLGDYAARALAILRQAERSAWLRGQADLDRPARRHVRPIALHVRG